MRVQIGISASKYNEVSPKEIEVLVKNYGAKIIKSELKNGVVICAFSMGAGKGNTVVYSDDMLEINNIRLPLASDSESYFDTKIKINAEMLERISFENKRIPITNAKEYLEKKGGDN